MSSTINRVISTVLVIVMILALAPGGLTMNAQAVSAVPIYQFALGIYIRSC